MADSSIQISNTLPLPSQNSPNSEKKRKLDFSSISDLPVGGYTADIDEDLKAGKDKKKRKIKKSKKDSKKQKIEPSNIVEELEDTVIESIESIEPPLKKKHYRKLSKDEKEDRRRSPATLKLLVPLEDWYDSTDAVTVDEDEMDDVRKEPPQLAKKDVNQTPIPPPQRIFSTQYPPIPRASTTKSIVKAAGHPVGRLRKIKPELQSDVMSDAVASLSEKLSVMPKRKPSKFKMPVRGSEDVIGGWEKSPGKLRGSVHTYDDSERTENIAYSKHYIEECAPNQTIKFERLAYKVVMLDPGAECDLSIGRGLKLCSLVRGGPVVVSLFSGDNRDGKAFRVNTGGIWTIRGGQNCHMVNEGETVVELFTFSEGEYEK